MYYEAMIAPIFMADVSNSRGQNARATQTFLSETANTANEIWRGQLQSPLTVTLGDELQGIAGNFASMVSLVFFFERNRLKASVPFSIHYSIVLGEIDTAINPDIAHGMLGEGLTRARELLTMKNRKRRFVQVETGREQCDQLIGDLFDVVESIIDDWSVRDYRLIDALIENENDQEVGNAFRKNRSQIWKRRKTLKIASFVKLRDALVELGRMVDEHGG